ncbi:hypothetical protein BHE74_00015984, partial [Ensete ventricosum]
RCSRNSSGDRRKLAESIGCLSRVHRELTESDWELARNALGVHQKITETCREFAEGYREDHREL